MNVFKRIFCTLLAAKAAYLQLGRGVSIEAVTYSINRSDSLMHDPWTKQPDDTFDANYQPF